MNILLSFEFAFSDFLLICHVWPKGTAFDKE